MPALWQSSQQPMYVRTVWVGGFRHAVISHDDPFFIQNPRNRRPHSSATCTSNKTRKRATTPLDNNLEDCLRKINFVIKEEQYRRPITSQPEIERLDLAGVDQESDDEFLVKANQQPLYEFGSCRYKLDNTYLSMRTLKTNRSTKSDAKENSELSDRVLQWLDLAGKVDLLAPDNNERMTQPRHSWPEIQKRNLIKSKTAVDFRSKESKPSPKGGDSAKPQPTAIDRHDFYVPTSANTIENYARQSRNQNTPHEKPKDNKTKGKDMRSNIQETRQKVVSERSAMEKQYADLLSKKLIPDLKANKKQVHIFMPELPKKTGSTATSRTESLLSQFSQLSQKLKQ